MNSIDARIAAIAEAIERRKMEQSERVDELSKSLFEFEDYMASLDEIGIAALAAMTNEDGGPVLTLEQAQGMVDSFKRDATDRRLCAFRSGV